MSSQQSSWPAHLRDNAPFRVCGECQRKTWDAEIHEGDSCAMRQPDGSQCDGQFGLRWFYEGAPPTTGDLLDAKREVKQLQKTLTSMAASMATHVRWGMGPSLSSNNGRRVLEAAGYPLDENGWPVGWDGTTPPSTGERSCE